MSAMRTGVAVLLISACLILQARGGENEKAEGKPAPKTRESFVKDGKLDVEAAVSYFEDLYRSDSSVGRMRLRITRPRNTRSLEMKARTKGKEKALIVIEKPPREEGTATLRVGKNLWNYFPRIRRTIRIPPSMMQSGWMGSDFTNDDLVRETSYVEDYDYELVGRSEEPEGWLIRFRAKPDLVGLWNSIELVLDRDGRIPLRARYYDRKDRLARTMHFDRVRIFDGKRLPSHLMLVPEDKNREWAEEHPGEKPGDGKRKHAYKTEMTYLELEFGVKLPDSTFSLSRLERKR